MYVHTCIYICMYICVCVYAYMYVCIYTYVYIYICMHMSKYIYTYIPYICIYKYTCTKCNYDLHRAVSRYGLFIYIYKYKHTYRWIYICIYTNTYICWPAQWCHQQRSVPCRHHKIHVNMCTHIYIYDIYMYVKLYVHVCDIQCRSLWWHQQRSQRCRRREWVTAHTCIYRYKMYICMYVYIYTHIYTHVWDI